MELASLERRQGRPVDERADYWTEAMTPVTQDERRYRCNVCSIQGMIDVRPTKRRRIGSI
jgi:DNA-directed RNA polymerase subunit RPC12/RpoP